MRIKTPFVVALAVAGMVLHAQSDSPRPQFEVASVKPDDGSSPRMGVGINASGMFTAQNVTVHKLITEAYDLRDVQVVGGPGWIDSDRFDITAKPHVDAKDGQASMSAEKKWAEAALMLQSLLEDRFQLKVRRETRELPVYVLSVAKNGFKPMAKNCVTVDPQNPPSRPAPGQKAPQFCGNIMFGRNGQDRTMDGSEITVAQLFQYGLGNSVDRIIVDKTGLAGNYTFHLEWAPDAVTAGDQGASTGPSLFTALEEQLGLRLESTKGPVDVLVVESVAKPSEN